MNAAEFTTQEQEEAKTAAYEAELLRRYLCGEPLSAWDKADARRILRVRKLLGQAPANKKNKP